MKRLWQVVAVALCVILIGGCGKEKDTQEGRILSLVHDFEKGMRYDLEPDIEIVTERAKYDNTSDNTGFTIKTTQGYINIVISPSEEILSFQIKSDSKDEKYLKDAFDYWTGRIKAKPDISFSELKDLGSAGYSDENGFYNIELNENGYIQYLKR